MRDMTMLQKLIAVSTVFGAARKIEPSTVSRLALGDGQRLPLILAGRADLTTRRFEKTIKWFSDNWPEAAEWPAGIERPVALAPEAAA